MLYKRAQCCIFFLHVDEADWKHGEQHHPCSSRSTDDAPSPSASAETEAYALLAEVFMEEHPGVEGMFQQAGIHVLRNTDKPQIFTEEDVLEYVQISLDESPSATLEPLHVFCSGVDARLVSRLFRNAIIRIDCKVGEIDSVRPSVDCSNSEVFERILSRRFTIQRKGRYYPFIKYYVESILLHLAIEKGQDTLVGLLLEHGAEYEATTLHLAADKGYFRIVQQLLERGASINAKNGDGYTPLLVAEHPEVLKILIQNGADISGRNCLGSTALHKVARHGLPSIFQLLIERGAAIDVKDDIGYTPLHYAVMSCKETSEILIESGANVNAKTDDGYTVLQLAAYHFCPLSVIQLLVERGAVVNARDDSGCTPLHYTRCPGIADFLLRNDATIDAQDDSGETPLHYSASRRDEVAKILLENGANVHVKSNYGRTALHETVIHLGSLSVTQLLIEKGAVVDARDSSGCIPLHHAFCPDIAELLLQNGADVNSLDFEQKTPIYRRIELNRFKVLIKYGAHVKMNLVLKEIMGEFILNTAVFQFLLESYFVDLMLLKEPSIQECIDSDFLKGSTLTRHLLKVAILNLKQHNSDGLEHLYLGLTDEQIAEFTSECELEIARMRSWVFCDTDISLYDILTKNVYKVACLLRNENIFIRDEWKEQFPIYGNMLTYHIEKGKLRKSLVEDGIKICSRLLRPQVVPDEINDLLFRYLTNEDIFRLKRACARFTISV